MEKHCELNRTAMVRLKNIFSRQQKKNNTYLVLSFRCFQKAARFLLGENASCHLVCLTALQAAHRWTVEKRNTESE